METDVIKKKFKAFTVRKIYQKDLYTFNIEWSDGKILDYRLSTLQKHCPCAACVDETTGQRLLKKEKVDDYVLARRIVSVGRYALRIEFTSGCSNGIYSFDALRQDPS